jgi:chemotaxis protein CheX
LEIRPTIRGGKGVNLGDVMGAFVEAVGLTLRESAATESGVVETSERVLPETGEGLSAALAIRSARVDQLVLCLPEQTAAALAERVLAGASPDGIDAEMVRDCAGELANVMAGQAKALLSGTADRLSFSTPTVFAGPNQPLRQGTSAACHVASFDSEAGPFALRLYACEPSADR